MSNALTLLKQSNASHGNRRRVGQVTLYEDQTFRTSEQTACNYDDITVPAGTTAVIETNGYWVYVALPGTITASLWVNRVLGSSTSKTNEHVGQERAYHIQAYAYEAANVIAAEGRLFGVAGEVTLDEGVYVVASHHIFPDGSRHTSWGFATAV